MQDKKYSGVAVDTWALGVLLFLLLTGKYPFQPCPTRENMFKKICAGDFDVPGHVSQGARQVLAGLLQADPEKRMKLGAVRRSNCCKSRHTLHVTRHTSHVTRHSSGFAMHMGARGTWRGGKRWWLWWWWRCRRRRRE